MKINLEKFASVPSLDWFDLAADRITRQIEVELRDSEVYARVNLLEKRGDITPTHAHPFAHVLVCGRGEIGLSKIVDGLEHLTRLKPGAGANIAAGIEHTIIALQDNSGFACLFPHRNPQGEIVPEWTGWAPGQGSPRDPNGWRRGAKTLYVLTEVWGEYQPGFVVMIGQAPQDLPSGSFIEIEVHDAPSDAFWDLLDCHRNVFTKEPSKILPVRDRMLDLTLCRQRMSYVELQAAKRNVELLR